MQMAFFHFHLLLLLILFSCTAESAELWGQHCNDNSKINSAQLSKNINNLLPRLVSGTSTNSFITTSYGKSKDKVYGLAQCRGDVSQSDCTTCIQDAAKRIRQLCPNQADARIWYDYCFLRYDNQKFAGQVDTSDGIIFYNVENVTDPDSFNDELEKLTDKVSSDALMPVNRGLGKGKSELSSFITLYELVQCTRDLSPFSCAKCLVTAFESFTTDCQDRKGCRVLYSSCIVRYELYPFFFPLDPKVALGHEPLKNYYSVHKH